MRAMSVSPAVIVCVVNTIQGLLLLQPSLRVRRSTLYLVMISLRVGAGVVVGGWRGGTHTRPRALQLAQLVALNGSCCNLGADQERGTLPPPFFISLAQLPWPSRRFIGRQQRFIQLPRKARTQRTNNDSLLCCLMACRHVLLL